jgi:hypothetical protein
VVFFGLQPREHDLTYTGQVRRENRLIEKELSKDSKEDGISGKPSRRERRRERDRSRKRAANSSTYNESYDYDAIYPRYAFDDLFFGRPRQRGTPFYIFNVSICEWGWLVGMDENGNAWPNLINVGMDGLMMRKKIQESIQIGVGGRGHQHMGQDQSHHQDQNESSLLPSFILGMRTTLLTARTLRKAARREIHLLMPLPLPLRLPLLL